MADNVPTMVLDDDQEAEYLPTTDYSFYRIGDPVRIKPSPFNFDPRNPPSHPLAVSKRDRLIFVAHDSGFCVADTNDIKSLACSNPSNSFVLERSIVDVPLGEVRILALSLDNSTLAASVGGDVHIFSVNSLLRENEPRPSFSHSLNESVKDIRWRTKINRSRTASWNSFLVLSQLSSLYHGTEDGGFRNVLNNVDAVEWSTGGDYIVVAKEDNLSILSFEFEERSRMVLSFQSWIGDSDANCIVKVDSIRWVRCDSIIVGCFQLTEDGREENYLVQVIRSNDGNFSDASCKPIVISCPNLCSSINDNILPFGRGPYLLSSYLEECELAIIANKKSTDEHISYLGWSLGKENDEFAVIDIERDTRLPRIELQENDDDNLILGMCIDDSLCGRGITMWEQGLLRSRTEVIEWRRRRRRRRREHLSKKKLCNLMCLTVEGKLVLFGVFRS